MRRIQEISVIGVGVGLVVFVGLVAGAGGIVTSNDRPLIGQAPPINNTTAPGQKAATQPQSMGGPPQTYAVTAGNTGVIKTAQLTKYGDIGTQVDARIELTMSPSDVDAVQNISWVTDVRPVMRPEATQTDIGVPGSGSSGTLGVQQAHQSGITGDGVEVGIIGDAFDLTNPAIASNIVNARSFRETRGNPGAGTSKAEIVTRTAPDSQLHLVSAETDIDHQRAISYLNTQDVDIIVYGHIWYYPEDDGVNFLSDEINDATVDGSLVITQPGGYAQTHWEGEFRDIDSDDFHEWTVSGDELNALPDTESDFSGEKVQVTVRWEDEGDLSGYKPYLYNPITEKYIAEGETFDNNGDILATETNHYAKVSTEAAQQPLSLVIGHIQGPADDEIEVTVVEGPESIEWNVPASSIHAPGDVPAALTVAAYERYQNQLATYSGRGPTDDGRAGIDVTGYTNIDVTNRFEEDGAFGGTFASSAYVGGIAALIEDHQPGDQSPTELTNTLKSSSDDILDSGTDTASGSGVVNAADAVGVKETPMSTTTPEPTTTPRATPGNNGSVDVTRRVSENEIAPGEEVTVTTEITGVSGSVSTSSSYDPQLNSATVQLVTVNGAPAEPIISEATVNGSTVTLGDVGTDATVTIAEELTIGGELNVTHSITGSVTAGEITTEFEPVSITVANTEPQSVVDQYDANNDGEINIIELGQAGQAFASGELSITELGQIGAEFAS